MTGLTRWAVLAAATAVVAPLAAPGHAAVATAVASPQAATVGFATPRVVIVQGQVLTFVNLDTAGHTLTSVTTRKVRKGRRIYRVPIFNSGYVQTGKAPVKGTEKLKPGSYAFYCQPHGLMKGTLVVRATP